MEDFVTVWSTQLGRYQFTEADETKGADQHSPSTAQNAHREHRGAQRPECEEIPGDVGVFKESDMVVTAAWRLLVKRSHLSGRFWGTLRFGRCRALKPEPQLISNFFVFIHSDDFRRCSLHLFRVLLCFGLFLIIRIYCDFFLYSCLF